MFPPGPEPNLMRQQLIRRLRGGPGKWEQLFPKFRELGFVGIEAALPPALQRRHFRRLLTQHDLEYIPQIFTTGSNVAAHVESFRRQLDEAARLSPRFVNAHSGRDAWSETESDRYFEQVLALEKSAGIAVGHETHRGRILFNPWIASRLLERFD